MRLIRKEEQKAYTNKQRIKAWLVVVGILFSPSLVLGVGHVFNQDNSKAKTENSEDFTEPVESKFTEMNGKEYFDWFDVHTEEFYSAFEDLNSFMQYYPDEPGVEDKRGLADKLTHLGKLAAEVRLSKIDQSDYELAEIHDTYIKSMNKFDDAFDLAWDIKREDLSLYESYLYEGAVLYGMALEYAKSYRTNRGF
ncbi:hypothetical protein GCM10007216_18310 [Thalassobacillus devorans]|uniref:Uncharacterized protein n=1 Tax=Thalassobacillus devorans TaxID=279813 RepID=A0ABQ1P6S8_9BACI|nr:hypothetical protein [Thalassobacillus devorans]NIK28225.1 hypothetical protein [Thalassobacillus devorans]GGC87900.1 hypothetical protein GCM10007216_18310 [Thalassobacillus devorans]